MLRVVFSLVVPVLCTQTMVLAQAQPLPRNGDFETVTARQLGQARGQPYFELADWQATAGNWVAQAGTYYRVRAAQASASCVLAGARASAVNWCRRWR